MSSEAQTTAGGGEVRIDRKKTRIMGVYLATLGAAGIGVCVATALMHWGFWGWLGGGMLVFAGLGGLAGMKKMGGAGELACPACQKPISILHMNEERTIPCPHCATYLEGSTTMQKVPQDRVAKGAPFEAPLAESFRWPEGCPVCRGPVTGTVTVEGMSMAGTMALVAAPVAVARVSKVDAPCCDAHKDGVFLRREGSKPIIAFRSFAYYREFVALNQPGPTSAS